MWKERNKIVIDNEEFSIHRLKYSFVCNLWSWIKLYIDADPLSLIDFFDWLGSRRGQARFLFFVLFCSFLPFGTYCSKPFDTYCILPTPVCLVFFCVYPSKYIYILYLENEGI